MSAATKNLLSLVTVEGDLAANSTLTISANAAVRPGAELIVMFDCDGTARSLQFTGDVENYTATGTANKITSVRLLFLESRKYRVISVSTI